MRLPVIFAALLFAASPALAQSGGGAGGMLPSGGNSTSAALQALVTNAGSAVVDSSQGILTWALWYHDGTGQGLCPTSGSTQAVTWNNANPCINADVGGLVSYGLQLINYDTVGGTITAGDLVGYTATIGAHTYTVAYKAIGTEGTFNVVATGLAACANNPTGAQCYAAIDGATPTQGNMVALNAWNALGDGSINSVGHRPGAGLTSTTGKIAFDVPWTAQYALVAYANPGTGGHLTSVVQPQNQLDNDPVWNLSRLALGRLGNSNDQIGRLHFETNINSTTVVDTDVGDIALKDVNGATTNPTSEMQFWTANGTTPKGGNEGMVLSQGLRMVLSGGDTLSDPGIGNFAGGTLIGSVSGIFGETTSSGEGNTVEAVATTPFGHFAPAISGASGTGTSPTTVLGGDDGSRYGGMTCVAYNHSGYSPCGIWTGAAGTTGLTGMAALFNTDQTLSLPNITTDATHTDATLCEDTTTHKIYSGSGASGICLGTSSLRFKTDVHPLIAGLADIMAMRPIDYRYKPGYGGAGIKYGFAAEDMEQVLPQIVGHDPEGRPNTIDWAALVPVLVHAMQAQQHEIDALKTRLH